MKKLCFTKMRGIYLILFTNLNRENDLHNENNNQTLFDEEKKKNQENVDSFNDEKEHTAKFIVTGVKELRRLNDKNKIILPLITDNSIEEESEEITPQPVTVGVKDLRRLSETKKLLFSFDV